MNVDVYFIVKGGLVGRSVLSEVSEREGERERERERERLLLRLESTCQLNFSTTQLLFELRDEENLGGEQRVKSKE